VPKKPEADPSIEWVDPPPPPRGRYRDVKGFIAKLQANPGQWAVVRKDAPSHNERQYLQRCGVEAVSRSNGDGTFTIYARWPVA
jgi:hypothetical protein